MSQNWMRHFELRLTDKNNNDIELGGLKVTFKINWFNVSTSTRSGVFKIYNLSRNTSNKILNGEFTKIRVIAGYDGIAPAVDASQVGIARSVDPMAVGQSDGRNYGQLFSGEIRYTLTGKDNPTDSYILIQAADSDRAFVTSTSRQTLAAGWTAATQFDALMKDFEANGVTRGRTIRFPPTVHSRGCVLHGLTRELMDNLAEKCHATWMLVDNQLHMMDKHDYVHEPVILNSATGLIGMPQQTIGNGINARCLINPNIQVNGLIDLNQASVYQSTLAKGVEDAKFSPDNKGNDPGNIIVKSKSIDADGRYLVQGIMYSGNTRGQEWYMDLACQSFTASKNK